MGSLQELVDEIRNKKSMEKTKEKTKQQIESYIDSKENYDTLELTESDIEFGRRFDKLMKMK
jgi:hypothetical protein